MGATGLLSPRASSRDYEDVSDRPAPVVQQRVRRHSSRRRRARRLARWRRVALVALVAAVVLGSEGAALRWLLTSPRFAVTTVEVRGAGRLPEARVREVAGVAPGTNVFRVDTVAAAERLQQLPEIRHAEVARALPAGVVISIEERRPFTLVHAGRLHWIDEDGMAFGAERRAITTDVPIITGLTPQEVTAMRSAPSAKARVAIELIRAIRGAHPSLLGEISEIDVSGGEGPVLYTLDGVEVRLGVDQWAGRLARLEGVLEQIAATGQAVNSIDLRFRDQVVLKGAPR